MNVKNLVLGIGIFIVYMLALGYGIEAFYPSPDYNEICHSTAYSRPYPIEAKDVNCTITPQLQEEMDKCYKDQGFPENEYDSKGCISSITCNYCNRDYQEAEKVYSKWLFVVALVLGIITLLVGYSILSIEPVGSSLIGSGIGAILYGSVRNWANLQDVWRFLLLFACLALLIWIAIRLNKVKKR